MLIDNGASYRYHHDVPVNHNVTDVFSSHSFSLAGKTCLRTATNKLWYEFGQEACRYIHVGLRGHFETHNTEVMLER